MGIAIGFPDVSGDYQLGRADSAVAVAVVGRGEVEVPGHLFHVKGTYKTENLGIEKIVANIVRRPAVRHLVVCGREEFGHYPGDALRCLWENGMDENKRIIGTRSPIPFLCNTPHEAVQRFREQVTLHDLVQPKEVDEIVEYDPAYSFEDHRRQELMEKLEELERLASPPLDLNPIFYDNQVISGEAGRLGKAMNSTADRIVSAMLTLPYEKLVTHAGLVVVSQEHRLMMDPVEGSIAEVPSLELAQHLRRYLTGED
ncbi:MAG: hypothetical protein PHW93_05475 [Candidatus Methanomethylophilaceae archaeon]|nr:hypothetical protein [Candidatus Methanomethylophilaceae archaeon]